MDLAGMKRRELQALCKRHGLPAGGSNADLVARLDAALSGSAGAEEEEVAGVPARKGCLKRGDAAEAKKVTFAAEEGKARRLRSRVIWSPIVGKTRGKSAQASSAAAGQDSISEEVGTNVLVRRSRRNSVSAVEAEDVGEAIAVDRKRKNQENDESVAVSAQVGVSSRVTRRSSLAGPAAVLPPAGQKKRGRGKAAGGSNKLVDEVQDSEPDVQNTAQAEVSARVTRSRTTAPVVMSPTVVDNKRRKIGDAQINLELPTVSDVPRNDAPVTRSLRSRVVQVNDSMVDETHTARQLENKTQPSRPPTRRHQQVSSSVEDKNQEQTTAPNKAPILRRSRRNHSENAEKQPEVKEPVNRSTRKSVVPATLEKEENDLIEEKNPEAHVRRSTRKSIVPAKDIKGIGEKIQDANSEDAAKQPATKGPIRGSRRKSVVSELHKKEKGVIAEKNTDAHKRRSMQKPVMPVKDIKAVVEGIQNAKGKDVEKQFVVKQPTRRSSRKSVLPDMLENDNALLAAEMNAEMNVRRSTRKSVLPNMLNEENQDHIKMARNENFQSGKCQDDERQQKVKEPIRRSRRSVVAVPFEEQNSGRYEENKSKIPMRRSTRKSVALNEVEMVSMDDPEIVAQEPERVGEEGLILRKHRRSSLEISSSANDSWKMEDFDGQKFRKQQNTQISNEKDNTEGTQQALNSTILKGRSSKRRRTTVSEEVRSVKEANDDIIIREATKDAHKTTHEYKESGSRVHEFGHVNATREDHSSGPLLVTVTLTDEISTVQSVPVVIPGSEFGDNANESSDSSKQDHSDIQAVDSHLSEIRGELGQSSCIAGLAQHNFDVSEDKSLMSKDGLSIDFTVGYREEQSSVFREGSVSLEANASELVHNVMSTGLHGKSLQHDTDTIAEETDKDVLPMAFPIEEHGEKYAVSPVAVEKSVGWDASASESSGKSLTGIFSNDLHTKHLQHDCDVLTKETGEVAEESIRAAGLGKCPSRHSIGNPLSTSLHLEGAADNSSLPILNADNGCSSNGRSSSFGLELIFSEECKESYSRNAENTAVEIDGGNKPSTPGTPGFYVRSDFLEDVDVQPTEYGADKKLDVDEGVAEEHFAQEKSNDRHVPAKTDLNMKLNDQLAGPGTESGRSVTENNTRPDADSLDEQAIILVQQGDVQEGDLKKPSPCSTTPEWKHKCGLPKETVLSPKNTGSVSGAEQSPFGLESLFSQENIDESMGSVAAHTKNEFDNSKDCHVKSALENTHVPQNTAVEIDGGKKHRTFVTPGFYVRSDCLEDDDVQPTECDADKKLDVDEGVIEEDFAKEKSNDRHVPAKTDLNLKLNDQLAGPGTESGGSITEKNTRLDADNLDEQAIILVQQGEVQEGDLKKPSPCSTTPEWKHKCGLPKETVLSPKNTGSVSGAEQSPFGLESLFSEEDIDESMGSVTAHTKNGFDDLKDCHVKSALENTQMPDNTAVEIDGGNKPSTPMTPGFYVRSDCLEDDVQPTKCDADKKLDVDEGVPEEDFAQEKCNDQHVPAETDLNMKLNDQLAGPGTESGCSITEKNTRLVADNLDEQAIILVQQGDMQEGDLKKLPPCSTTPEWKHKCGLPEETVLSPKNTGSLSSAEQSPFGLEFLFSKENIDESMESVTAHTKIGFDDSTDCHVKYALENTHVPDNAAVEIDGGNKPSTPMTPGVRSDCLEDKDVQPTECDTDTKLDVDEGVAEEDFAQEKSNDRHVPAETDLNMKLNDQLAGPGMESGCSITEKNTRLVADNLDEQAIILVQQGDVQEGDLKKPSPCSTIPEWKHKCGLPEKTVLSPKNTGSPSSAEQSPFGLESLFSLESIDKSVGRAALASATAHTENGFDDSKGCHVQSALESNHVSEPFSHDDAEEGISKNDDSLRTSQQDNGVEEANHDEERVLSVFSLNQKHIKELINLEEVACEGEGSKMFVHSEELKASSEKTNVNGPADGNGYGTADAVLSTALHIASNDDYEICLGSNTDVLHQGHNDKCCDDTEDIIEDASAKYIERGAVLLSGKERLNLKDGELNSKLEGAKVVESGLYFNKGTGNILDSASVIGEIAPSGSGLSKDLPKEYGQEVLDGFSVQTSLDGSPAHGEKIVCRVDANENEGALSEESACTMKNFIGTRSSNPRELLMELQSLFLKGNTKESGHHDGLAFPSAENSGDESIKVEQRVKVHHGSNLSHLDELIGCSNTEVLCQGYSHKDRSNVDRVKQVASEPCTNDIVEAAATAKCIESGLVLPPSEERPNLNDGKLNSKLESPNIIVSGLSCDKDVCNTSDNGSIVVVVGERTPSGSCLPEDYPKDHYPRQELLDGFSVESSLQGTIPSTVCSVAAIGNPSSSLATPDYKYEGALPEEAECRMKNYTGNSSVDPRHLVMDLQSLFSEGRTEKSDMQDNLAFPSAESGRDERIICHVEKLVDTHVSSEPDTYQGPCQDHNRHEEKESCMSVPMQVKESGGFLRSSLASLSGSGPCQQHVNESTSMQVPCNIETPNQDHEEYNQNNEDQTTPGILSSSVPEAVRIEQSEMEIGLIPAAEALVLPVPDGQLNNKLEGTEFLNREASNLHKDDCMDLPIEDDHPNGLPAPRSPEQSAHFLNNDLGSIAELRSKLQSFKVSSTVKGSYIAMSAPRPKPRDSMSQSAIALLRNIENTPAVKAGHPVKPNADGKDSSRRALQPISGRPREH